MFTFLTSAAGLATIGGYIYVSVQVGRASHAAGNSLARAVGDAIMWPHSVAYKALKNLYRD